ncbi:AAA family ATPase, partial [Deinococcus pimensis]|uniref:AAA family ATPase n=1 Tax=Deinococcus pimensis TaxID=309888 RepID=UPI00146FC557
LEGRPAPAARPASSGHVAARPTALVGREDAWARMEAAWAAGQGVVLTGDPGVGKTRLAEEFLEAHGGGLRFEGRPGDAGVPYATHARTYRQVLAALPDLVVEPWVRDELSRIVPSLGGTPGPIDSDERKLRFWDAKARLLGQAVELGVRCLVFDDVQFMDEASIEAGGYIFQQLGWGRPDAPYRTIHIFRRGELTPFQQGMLHVLSTAGLVVIVELDPLGEHDVARLVDQLGVPGGEGAARDLARLTGGNPLLVLESARALGEGA